MKILFAVVRMAKWTLSYSILSGRVYKTTAVQCMKCDADDANNGKFSIFLFIFIFFSSVLVTVRVSVLTMSYLFHIFGGKLVQFIWNIEEERKKKLMWRIKFKLYIMWKYFVVWGYGANIEFSNDVNVFGQMKTRPKRKRNAKENHRRCRRQTNIFDGLGTKTSHE